MKLRISIVFALILSALFVHQYNTSAATGYGLPCASGGPDYRDHMTGAMPGRIVRLDNVANGGGEQIRPYVGFDAMFLAQCIDPSGPAAVQTLFDALQGDVSNGIITQCSDFSIDSTGNIKLCGNDANSYIGLSGGDWTWDNYPTTDPGTPTDPTTPGGGGGTDPGSGVIPPVAAGSEANAVPGWGGQLAFSPKTNLWLVTGSDGKVNGQMMNEKNKPVGNIFTIAGNGGAPKVTYDPVAEKFLVVWIDYTHGKGHDTISGQYFSSSGAPIGSSFTVHQGPDITLNDHSPMLFDQTRKKFVFTWNDAAGGSLMTVGENSELGQVIKISGDSTAGPYVSINNTTGEYCVAYQWYVTVRGSVPNSSSLVLRSVNPDTGALGQESFVSDDIFSVEGIVYDSADSQYLPFWFDMTDFNNAPVYYKTISTCADDPNSEPQLLSNGVGAMVIAYNSGSNTIGIIGQDGPDYSNTAYIIDAASGASIGSEIKLYGGGNGNFDPVIAPNITTGTFAAISSEDHKITKFIANLGWPDVTTNIGKKVILPAAQPLNAPTEGLPTDLGQFIGAIFLWSLRIIGLVIFVRFFWAGFKWFTAAGNSSRISSARDIMKNAALGAVVLFAAYLILYSINPDFVAGALNLPGISSTPTTSTTDICVRTGFCQQTGVACTWSGDNGVADNCDTGDYCAPTPEKSQCKTSGKTCSTDADCNK